MKEQLANELVIAITPYLTGLEIQDLKMRIDMVLGHYDITQAEHALTVYEGDINDLIYFYRLDENSLVYRLSSLIRSFRNLDYIAPALTGEDVMGVNASEWSSIISTLAAAGEYEVVILDLGVSLEDAVYLLSICDRVYMPVLDDRVSSAKTAQFFEAAGRCGAAGLQDKVKMLHLPVVREEVWGTDAPARLARGKMGAYVRRVLNER